MDMSNSQLTKINQVDPELKLQDQATISFKFPNLRKNFNLVDGVSNECGFKTGEWISRTQFPKTN